MCCCDKKKMIATKIFRSPFIIATNIIIMYHKFYGIIFYCIKFLDFQTRFS